MHNEVVSETAKSASAPEFAPQAFSIKNTLHILGISRTLLWKSISSGHIKVVRLGRRTLIPTSEIKRLLGS
jgi:excisionase family DNA binding protein